MATQRPRGKHILRRVACSENKNKARGPKVGKKEGGEAWEIGEVQIIRAF